MNKSSLLRPALLSSCLFLPLGACASSGPANDVAPVVRHNVSDMNQLTNVGNVWISEQPTESELIWMRDNKVSMVIDVRGRSEDRGFEERAYVVSLGMRYQSAPLEIDQDFVVRYFDSTRDILRTRKDIPTLIHCATANRAAAVWMVYRVLDEKVAYPVALAEAEIAGLNNEATLSLVQQYLLANGVEADLSGGLNAAAPLSATDGPDEVIYTDTPEEVEERGETGETGETGESDESEPDDGRRD